jgi:hypothetical protein
LTDVKLKADCAYKRHRDSLTRVTAFQLSGVEQAVSRAGGVVWGYATLVGGHGEFIEHRINAYAAHSRNPSQVVSDLADIMSDENIAAVGVAGRETVRDRFSMTAMGDRLEEVLKLAINGPTGKPAGPSH